MSRKTCPYCQTIYRSAGCPHCREERRAMQNIDQPDWEEILYDEWMEEIDRENGELPYYAYDFELDNE